MPFKYWASVFACVIATLCAIAVFGRPAPAGPLTAQQFQPCIEVDRLMSIVKRNNPAIEVEQFEAQRALRFLRRFNGKMIRSKFWADTVLVARKPGEGTFRVVMAMRGCVFVNSYFPMRLYRVFVGEGA